MTGTAPEKTPIIREVTGLVVSDAMEKSIVVRIDRTKVHRRYKKVTRVSKRLHVHDEKNDANVGDTVRVIACRPMSKTKTWRLVEVVQRAK